MTEEGIKVTLRNFDILRENSFLMPGPEPFTGAIARALNFPPHLYVGSHYVWVVSHVGEFKEYRLPTAAQWWKNLSDMGEPMRPLIFHLFPTDGREGSY
jgi:hypothetical protein